jgi:anti-sigma regulatory factor (Ser/Thr protein kinase)
MARREQRTYTSDVRELRRMSAWWREWAASIDPGTEVQNRGELCLNEAVANIIQHGGSPSAIRITLDADVHAVRMTIADDGEPFDPLAYPKADLPRTLDEARPGGLGLHILRTSADVVDYGRLDGWNTVTLTFVRS